MLKPNLLPTLLTLASTILAFAVTSVAGDLPSKKYLNLATIKKMIAAAEAEA